MKIYYCGSASIQSFLNEYKPGEVVIRPAPKGLRECAKAIIRWMIYLSPDFKYSNCWCRFIGHSFVVSWDKRYAGKIAWNSKVRDIAQGTRGA